MENENLGLSLEFLPSIMIVEHLGGLDAMIMPTLAHFVCVCACVCLFLILNFYLFFKTSAMLVNLRVNFLLDVPIKFVF